MKPQFYEQSRDPAVLTSRALAHHISEPPPEIEINEGFCTVFALATTFSYVLPTDSERIDPKGIFAELFDLIQKTPIENTPLAQAFQADSSKPPVINTDDGGSFLDTWLTPELRGTTLSFLNPLLKDNFSVQLVPIDPEKIVPRSVAVLRRKVLDKTPVIVTAVYRDTTAGAEFNHHVVISPFSTKAWAIIHDSNLDRVQAIPWSTFVEAAASREIVVGKVSSKRSIRFDLNRIMIGVQGVG